MRSRSAVAALAVALATIAQADYLIEPKSVPLSTRQSWCESEKQSCPFICQQTEPGNTLVNECDAEKLTYGCLCGDNKRPNISEFTLTLPYFVCREWGNQCVADCNHDNACAAKCRQDNPCGASDPKKLNSTSTATVVPLPSASQTDDPNVIYSGTPGEEDNSKSGSGHKGAAAAVEAANAYGTAIIFAGVFVGFAML